MEIKVEGRYKTRCGYEIYISSRVTDTLVSGYILGFPELETWWHMNGAHNEYCDTPLDLVEECSPLELETMQPSEEVEGIIDDHIERIKSATTLSDLKIAFSDGLKYTKLNEVYQLQVAKDEIQRLEQQLRFSSNLSRMFSQRIDELEDKKDISLTRRDQFAMAAMQGLLSGPAEMNAKSLYMQGLLSGPAEMNAKSLYLLGKESVEIADSLIAELDKQLEDNTDEK